MGTRINPLAGRHFNNPEIATALSSLASSFAPPSAGEVLGWEKARSERADAQRLSDLWAAAGDDFDKMGVAAGQWNPTSSYYAVDTADATARRGQDVAAETSLQNNAADNQTALYKEILGLGGTVLEHGDAMPGIPANVAEALGVPAFPAQRGSGLGAMPDPLSTDEVNAMLLEKAIRDGNYGPADAVKKELSEVPLEKILGPEGDPLFVNRPDADGQQPYINKGAEAKPELETYRTPSGETGTAIYDTRIGKWLDTQTRAVLPEGTVTGKISDTAEGLGATTSNVTEANQTFAEANYGLARLQTFRTLLQDNPGALGLTGMVRGFAQDLVAAADEAGAAYGVINSLDELRALTARVGASGRYDPSIAQANAMALEMAYLQAKVQDPGGEVNVRELERLLGVFDGGLAGNAKVLANLDILETQLNERKNYANELRGASPAPAATEPPGPVRVFDDAGYDALPPGALFIDPDGNERRKP